MNGMSIVVLAKNNNNEISALITKLDAVLTAKHIAYEVIFVTSAPNKMIETAVDEIYSTLPLRYYTFDDDPPARQLALAVAAAMYETIGFIQINQINSIQSAIDTFTAAKTRPNITLANHRHIFGRRFCNFISWAVHYSYGLLPMSMSFMARGGMQIIQKRLLLHIEFDDDGPRITPDFLAWARQRYGGVVGYNLQPNADTTIKKAGSFKSAFLILWRHMVPERYEEFDDAYRIVHGSGFRYRGREYITHNKLPRKNTAVERTTPYQRFVLIGIACAVLVGVITDGNALLIDVVSLITILYFFDLLFNMFLIYRSLRRYSEMSVDESDLRKKRTWPTYTVLCPLYKEALVVLQFISAMRKLDYPKKSLNVMLLLESNDTETIDAIRSMNLPKFFTIVVVPHSLPKTKPKACNYGLLRAKGEYCVIYDAEDIPDPQQLKKAVIAFERAPQTVACIQAKLNYYNWNQNLLTRLFTLEYSLWFNLILTGLQSIKAPIPLGGTSNHFKTAVLRELGGWDPFNVTEDADLGIRLSKRGLTTAILDSTTYEEANSALGNWLRQRSRWIKGYIQTYLVHMRDVRELGRNGRRIDMLTFQLVIGGKIISMLVNPTLWVMTIGYFVFRDEIGGFIESLYVTPIFYIGAFALIVGNFLYLYYYMIGALRQGRPELAVFTIFVPFYWLMMSIAASLAMYDLIVRPFHWHKTKHGLHLKKVKETAS